jgi:hypothetical protein
LHERLGDNQGFANLAKSFFARAYIVNTYLNHWQNIEINIESKAGYLSTTIQIRAHIKTREDNKMKLAYRSCVVVSLLLTLPLLASAQTNEQFADLNDTIEMVRSMAALERRTVIAEQLKLTGEESTKFWPIYDEYAVDKKRINDRLVKIITDYGANFEDLSDELATSLVDDHMDVQSDLLKLRSKYLRKFNKVLAPKTLARFYQIENKMDAVTNVVMAQGIPLITE